MTPKEGSGERRRVSPLITAIISGIAVGMLMLVANLFLKDRPAAARQETRDMKEDIKRIDKDLTSQISAQIVAHENLNRDVSEMKRDIKEILRAVK